MRRVGEALAARYTEIGQTVAARIIHEIPTTETSRPRLSREAGVALAGSAIEAIDSITTQAAEAHVREESRLRTQTGRAARDLVERLSRAIEQPAPESVQLELTFVIGVSNLTHISG